MTEGAALPVFEAVIVPHRSLSRRGLLVLISFLSAVSGVIAIYSALLGAWPVSGFAGAEVGIAAALLWLSGRRAGPVEILALSTRELTISRIDRRSHRTERRLPAGWLIVSLRERAGRVPALVVATHGMEEEIAQALGETEKRELARALHESLQDMRKPKLA